MRAGSPGIWVNGPLLFVDVGVAIASRYKEEGGEANKASQQHSGGSSVVADQTLLQGSDRAVFRNLMSF
jgi:hypothetical protein